MSGSRAEFLDSIGLTDDVLVRIASNADLRTGSIDISWTRFRRSTNSSRRWAPRPTGV